jgi:hypothetical protein
MQPAASQVRSAEGDASPELTGATSARRILKIAPEWKSRYESYAPPDAAIEKLREAATALKHDVRVDVVFGSWCGDSREQVPKFLKVRSLLGGGLLPSSYFGVTRDKKSPPEAVQGRDIERVPTFIVSFRGSEIGRIVETPKESIEADLLEILAHPR